MPRDYTERTFKKGEKVVFDAPDYQKIPATVTRVSHGGMHAEVSIRFNKPVTIDAEDQGFNPGRKYIRADVPAFSLLKKSKLERLS